MGSTPLVDALSPIPGSLELALHEITLAVFTTLAPAGILAFALLGLAVGFAPRLGQAKRASLWHWSVLPLFVALLGLLVSANHLGTPANALYVFSGVGRSPLSNEIMAVALALGAGGVYWLCSYAAGFPVWIRRVWAAVDAVLCLVAMTTMSVAYDVSTILTWSGPLVAANLWATGLAAAGPAVLLTAEVAGVAQPLKKLCQAIVAGSAFALLVAVGLTVAQWLSVREMGNAVASAASLVPLAWGAVVVYGLAGAASLILAWLAPQVRRPRACLILACALSLIGLFCLRFFFYLSHMTAGISL